MPLAAQPNEACHLTLKPHLQDPPAPPLPHVVAMVEGSPRYSELWYHPKKKREERKTGM